MERSTTRPSVTWSFLDAALSENLRMNGPANVQVRACAKDCEVHYKIYVSFIVVWRVP